MKTTIFNKTKMLLTKYEPEILTAMGIGGLIFSLISTAKATVAATKTVSAEQEKQEKPLTKKEIFKLTWKYYVPAAASALISIPCIIFGNRVASKRTAAFAAAYSVSEAALQEYQNKTLEIVGPKKEQEIHEAISKDIVEKTYPSAPAGAIVLTGDGDNLFYEPLSGRYFKSNWNKILKAANELNASALCDIAGQVTLTEWFNKLGLDKTDISDELGWSTEFGSKGIIDITIDSTLTPEDIPCGSIHYVTRPRYLD